MTIRPGTVYLVGAGPGDPDLITVRGRELLRRADVVLHDRLVLDALLLEARPDAVLIDVGKGSRGESEQQEAINAAIVAHAQAGHVVVRLKGGDPYVFGRGWEEREACQRAGIACDVVPGVSSALAAPAVAGIPVTYRGVASSVAIIAAPAVDDDGLRALTHVDTSVFLMGVGQIRSLTARLIAQGHAVDTPVAVVERATMPGERTVRARLDRIADVVEQQGITAPAVLVVGATTALTSDAAADVPGPLTGRRVVVTRPLHAAATLTQGLRARGADVVGTPLIRMESCAPVEPAWRDRLEEADWLVFSSRHGVRGFRRALAAERLDARHLAHLRIAAMGPVAAHELAAWGLRADLVARPAREAVFVDALCAQLPSPQRVLYACGTLARESLPTALAARRVAVSCVTVYATHDVSLAPSVRSRLTERVDAVVFAAPSAVHAFARHGVTTPNAVAICIGEATAAACMSQRWSRVVVADTHTDEGLVEATVGALQRGSVSTHVIDPEVDASMRSACVGSPHPERAPRMMSA